MFGCTSSIAPGMSVFTRYMERTCFMVSSFETYSKGIGIPNSRTYKEIREASRTYFELGITCFFYITIHVDLIVKSLVVFDNETFECCVFVTIKLHEQFLRRSQLRLFLHQRQGLLRFENYRFILNW